MYTQTSREKQLWTKPALASLNVGDAELTPGGHAKTSATLELNLTRTGPNS
jgi:hypothetical protein